MMNHFNLGSSSLPCHLSHFLGSTCTCTFTYSPINYHLYCNLL